MDISSDHCCICITQDIAQYDGRTKVVTRFDSPFDKASETHCVSKKLSKQGAGILSADIGIMGALIR